MNSETTSEKKSFWAGHARKIVLRQLAKLKHGVLTIHDPWGKVQIGEGRAGLFPEIHVHHPRFYQRVLFGGDLGAAESLMDGDWSSPSLSETVRFFLRNLDLVDRMDRGVAHWNHLISRWIHRLRRNTVLGAKRNISQHYDLGNDFYKLWLDEQMLYTCAYFPSQDVSLEAAQIAKMNHVGRKLRLQPGQEVVEAGCGWGALALHLGKYFGVKVKAYNISKQQLAYARERAQAEGMSQQVEYIEGDYGEINK